MKVVNKSAYIFYLIKYWRPLVHCNLFVCVDPDHEVVAHGLGLPQGVGVTEMNHVVATVAPNPNHLRQEMEWKNILVISE